MTDAMLIGGGGAVILFLIGLVWQVVTQRVDGIETANAKLREDFNIQQLKVAEDYVSREWLESALKPIMDELQKIDRKLDGKQDRLDRSHG